MSEASAPTGMAAEIPGRNRLVVSLPWVLLVLVLVAWGLAMYFDRGSDELTTLSDRIWAVSFLGFPIVGVVLASRLPSNPVGWLFIIGPLLIGAAVAGDEAGQTLDMPELWSLFLPAFPLGIVALSTAILLFPDGRYPNRWWPGLHWLSLLALPFFPDEVSVANLALGLFSLAYRAITGNATMRRQIAWPIFAASLGLGVFLATVLVPIPPFDTIVPALGWVLLTVGIPVAIAVSIFRYHLYDIDRIVSRTVGYGVLLALLGLVYVFGAVWLPARFIDEQPPIFVAGATLVVAALFNPVRKRVLGWVDHRFYRSRYDAERVAASFSVHLRDSVEMERLTTQWRSVVTDTVQPSSMGIWIRDRH